MINYKAKEVKKGKKEPYYSVTRINKGKKTTAPL